jgi:hypothetical protein
LCSDGQPAAMALLMLAATHATGRATRSRNSCRCTARRSSCHGCRADSSDSHINTDQLCLVESSSPRWRFPLPHPCTAIYGAMISRCSPQRSSAPCGNAMKRIDARLRSPNVEARSLLGVCAAGCHAAVDQHCTFIGHTPTSRQPSISTHTGANPAMDVSSTLLGPVDP